MESSNTDLWIDQDSSSSPVAQRTESKLQGKETFEKRLHFCFTIQFYNHCFEWQTLQNACVLPKTCKTRNNCVQCSAQAILLLGNPAAFLGSLLGWIHEQFEDFTIVHLWTESQLLLGKCPEDISWQRDCRAGFKMKFLKCSSWAANTFPS